MPAFLPALLAFGRAIRHRRAIRPLAEMDEHILRDIGLLRTDVLAALAQPLRRDPSRFLDTVCCRGRGLARRLRPTSEPATCC
jgi:uncharacterized protein YjiS (DUF1127 family)